MSSEGVDGRVLPRTGQTERITRNWASRFSPVQHGAAMRVTFLTHYPQLYGANRSLLDLIDGLRNYGVESSVLVSAEGPLVEELVRRGTPVRVLHLGRWASRLPKGYGRMPTARRMMHRGRNGFCQFRTNVAAAPAVVRQLRAWRSDIVYSNSSLLLSGAIAAGFLRLPHVWHLREFGDLDYAFVPDFGRTAQTWLINRAEGIVAVSEAVRRYYHLTASPRMKVVYSGIGWAADLEKLRPEPVRHPSDAPYTFALVGLLHPAKGQQTAIEALHELIRAGRNVKLVLAGSGSADYRKRLEDLVHRLNLGAHVHFHGFTDDVYDVYRHANAVLMCSRNEAMGRVTAEAMASYRPVIGFRGAGTAELIRHGETGLLYDGEHETLSASMTQFLDDPEWARSLGRRGAQRARDLFTIERYAAGVYDLLRLVLSDRETMPRTDVRAPAGFENTDSASYETDLPARDASVDRTVIHPFP
ncbi:MAG: glycosyltransferase family 4 protein [Rhodothermales bacterium]